MAMDFDDRVIVVTGAGGGLGKEYATLLAARGARVVVNDYGGTTKGEPGTISVAQSVVDDIVAAGGQAVASGVDVGTENSGRELVELALDTWGRIDGMIANAGASRAGTGIDANAVEDLLFTLNIHVAGTARLVKAAWPHLVEQGYGRIVTTCSDSIWGTPVINYVTAKGAILGYTRAAASEAAAHGITVNTVLPSAWTRMTAAMPPGEFRDTVERNFPPELVAPFVALLTHESCPWNGEAFQVGSTRAARVFLGVTRGFQAHGENALEAFAENSDAVADTSQWITPADMADSVDIMLRELAGEQKW